MGGVADDEDSGMLVGERRMPLGEETSRGPDDRLDSNILAMRCCAGEGCVVRAVCNAAVGGWHYGSTLASPVRV